MPFTYLSHQAPVLAVKMRWPAAFDGTAMVVGSMAPDWAYAVDGTRWAFDAHSPAGVVAFCVPVAVMGAMVLRRVSPVLFAYAPNPATLPLRQLRALAGRRPPLVTTVVSALVGALTHVTWDLFTHDDRWGPQHIAWLRSPAVSWFGHEIGWAEALQMAGHVVGAVLALWLLSRILTSGSFRGWYGFSADVVAPSRGRAAGAVRFWAITALGALAGVGASAYGDPPIPGRIIRSSLGLAAGLVAASVACAGQVRVPDDDEIGIPEI